MKCNAEERDDEEGGMIFPAETNDHRTPASGAAAAALVLHPCLVRNNIC